jgi:hypothetical protein
MKRGAVILSLAALVWAGCATTTQSGKPSYMTQPVTRTPLSQRKIVTTVFTNQPNAAPIIPAQQQMGAAQLTPTNAPPPKARILPMTGRIASVNDKLRFVVVDFTNSRRPTIDERLEVYRVGAKVAEIKVSGPYRNTTVAADIVAGEVKYGDEVKPQ